MFELCRLGLPWQSLHAQHPCATHRGLHVYGLRQQKWLSGPFFIALRPNLGKVCRQIDYEALGEDHGLV